MTHTLSREEIVEGGRIEWEGLITGEVLVRNQDAALLIVRAADLLVRLRDPITCLTPAAWLGMQDMIGPCVEDWEFRDIFLGLFGQFAALSEELGTYGDDERGAPEGEATT